MKKKKNREKEKEMIVLKLGIYFGGHDVNMSIVVTSNSYTSHYSFCLTSSANKANQRSSFSDAILCLLCSLSSSALQFASFLSSSNAYCSCKIAIKLSESLAFLFPFSFFPEESLSNIGSIFSSTEAGDAGLFSLSSFASTIRGG